MGNTTEKKEFMDSQEVMQLLRIKDLRTLNTYINSHIIPTSLFKVDTEDHVFSREEIFKQLNATDTDEPFMSFDEVCKEFNLTNGKLSYRIKKKEIPYYKLREGKGSAYLFRRSEIKVHDDLILEWEGTSMNFLIKHKFIKKILQTFFECNTIEITKKRDVQIFKDYIFSSLTKQEVAKKYNLTTEGVSQKVRWILNVIPGIIQREANRYVELCTKYNLAVSKLKVIDDENKELRKLLNLAEREESEEVNKVYKILSIPLIDLDLSVRCTNGLKQVGIDTLGDLIKYKEKDLFKIKNLGKKSINEILDLVKEKGLVMGMNIITIPDNK